VISFSWTSTAIPVEVFWACWIDFIFAVSSSFSFMMSCAGNFWVAEIHPSQFPKRLFPTPPRVIGVLLAADIHAVPFSSFPLSRRNFLVPNRARCPYLFPTALGCFDACVLRLHAPSSLLFSHYALDRPNELLYQLYYAVHLFFPKHFMFFMT